MFKESKHVIRIPAGEVVLFSNYHRTLLPARASEYLFKFSEEVTEGTL